MNRGHGPYGAKPLNGRESFALGESALCERLKGPSTNNTLA